MSFSGSSSTNVEVSVVDISDRFGDFARKEIFNCHNESTDEAPVRLSDDRGEAIAIMSKGLEDFLKRENEDGVVVGVIGLGGSGGTSLISNALRSLPIGIPKLVVSTVASGQTEDYIRTSDLVLVPSIVDICGINSVSRVVLSNAGAALSGMVIERLERERESRGGGEKFAVGLTMFAVTTQCVNGVKERLVKEGYETLVPSHGVSGWRGIYKGFVFPYQKRVYLLWMHQDCPFLILRPQLLL